MRAALITGGTSGIGLAFARALARQGHPLIVVARDHDRLATVSADLASAFGVSVETLAADLSDRADVDRVAARLRTGDVDILINNAGFSLKTPLVGGDEALADRAYEAMARTPRVLAAAIAPSLAGGDAGRVTFHCPTNTSRWESIADRATAGTEVWVSGILSPTAVEVTRVTHTPELNT